MANLRSYVPTYGMWCPDNYAADRDECTCTRHCDVDCEPWGVLNHETCECLPIDYCDWECDYPQVLDVVSCSCVDSYCDIECPPGAFLDVDMCACYIDDLCDIMCLEADGLRPDFDTCTCVPIET